MQGECASSKTWIDEEIGMGVPISVCQINDGEIDDPSRVEEVPWPEPVCMFCMKAASDVEYVIESPDKLWHICSACVETCVEVLAARRAESTKRD